MSIFRRIVGFLLLVAAGHATAQTANLDTLVSHGALIARNPSTGLVSFVGSGSGPYARLAPPAIAGDPAANARAHLQAFAPHFGVADVSQGMQLLRVRSRDSGFATRFQQQYQGIPVFAGDIVVNTDPSGALRAISGKMTDKVVDTTPAIDAAAAAQAALQATARKYHIVAADLRSTAPTLTIFDPRLLGVLSRGTRLAWRTVVTSARSARVKELVLIDANKGSVALAFTQIHESRNRLTYDTNSTDILPGTLECLESASSCTSGLIPDADNAHSFAGDVYDFYSSRFGRDAIDALGGDLVSTTRYCDVGDCPMINAFWNGEQMVYGSGMVADDVAAHEMTHGVTQAESGLLYFGEPGAINESISDIFGEFVDLTNGKGNDAPAVRWLMGEDTVVGAIRNMADPPAFGQPDRKGSPNWYTGTADNGGVHTNSGVGNKAAYLMVDGGSFNGKVVTGIGLEKAAQIYYEAQTMLLASGSNYADLYGALTQACTNLTGTHGITAADCSQVTLATQAVEMNAISPTTTAKPYCPAGGDYATLGSDDFESAGASGTLTRASVGGYWYLDSSLSTSGTYSALGLDEPFVTDSSLVYQFNAPIVAGDHLYFNHTWDTEYGYDGVVVEYSTNGGVSWVDAGSLLAVGQPYDAAIYTSSAPFANSPIAGRMAFTGSINFWTHSAYDLSPLAGKSLLWRFRSTSDGAVAYYGFNLDDVIHYRCTTGDIQLTSDAQSVNESMGSVVVTVSRGSGATGPASVSYATTNGSAMAGVDYTAKSGILSWLAGDARPKTFSVPIINRAGTQGDRTFTVSLASAVGAILGTPSVQTITIGNSDGLIQFDAPSISVNENGPNVVLTVNRTGFAGPAASVTWSTVAQTATSADFTPRTGVLTWGAGDATPRTITIGPLAATGAYVPIINDVLVEGPETFAINLSAPTGAALGTTASATVTILSDENGVSMATSTASVGEASGLQQVTVNRSGSAGAVNVNYSFTNGTAVNGVHFLGTNGSFHWDDGDNSPRIIPVTIIDDSLVNANRTFTVALSSATGATIAAPASTAVTIVDDDNTVQFTAATASVAESTASIVIPVSRLGSVTSSASVLWQTVDGSAFSGTDFGTAGNSSARAGTLTWAAGSSMSQNITIPIIQNGILNGARTFSVQLQSPVGTVLGTNPVITVTINDDERGVQFTDAGYVVTEGGSASLRVHRVGATSTAISANWATVNGSAVSGTDFGIAGSGAARTGMVSWGIGDAADKTITIPTIQNTVGGQPDRTFTVTLTPGTGVVLGSPGSATVTIKDDDIPPESTVRFDQVKTTVLENAGNAILTLHREDVGGGFGRDVTVKYSTLAGSALAASDFTAVTNGTVHWTAGDNSDKTISIGIVNNTTAEPPESFSVVLSQPAPGLGLGTPSQATVTILDDDELFPAFGAIPPGFHQSGTATKSWHVSNDPGAYEGAFSLKADEIDDNETAGIDMIGTFAAGNVAFRVKVSSEPGFDELRFYIDGVVMQKWSGTAVAGWQAASFPILAGTHTLSWVYIKDGSVSVGMDSAYLDGLVTPSFVPSP